MSHIARPLTVRLLDSRTLVFITLLLLLLLALLLPAASAHAAGDSPADDKPYPTQAPRDGIVVTTTPVPARASEPPLHQAQRRILDIGRPAATVALIETPIPGDREPITGANVRQLRQVAQWGRGSLIDVAYAPDGQSLIAGSAFGLAIYDLNNPEAAPRWLPFETPRDYQQLAVSAGGQFVKLTSYGGAFQMHRLADGAVVKMLSGVTWLRGSALLDNNEPPISPDGSRALTFDYDRADDSIWGVDIKRTVVAQATHQALFDLPDSTFYVGYEDWHGRGEGCDLASFNYCGNAYDPSSMEPYRVGFAPTNTSLTILYRAPNLWDNANFSTLRVYDGATGALTNLIGSFADPVQSFAYAPDGRTLAVAFMDGTLRLWDLAVDKPIFGARHFNNYAYDVDYSADGAYLLLQTPGELVVRRTADGALRGRYAAEVAAASPVSAVVALADGGRLRMLDLATGTFLTEWAAHEGGISSLVFSPDGALLVSAGLDCVIREWAAATGEFVHNFQENWTNAYGEPGTNSRIFIDALQFIPGTEQLLGYGSWARVVGWDANSGATEYFIEPDPLEYYSGMVTLNPHFPEFFGIDQAEGEFYVNNAAYAIADGAALGQAELPENLPAGCAPSGPLTLDGTVRFTRGHDEHEGQICVLNARTLALQATITVIPPEATETAPRLGWLYLSPDGGQLAVTVGGERVYVYQIADSAAPAADYQAQ